VKSIRRVGYVNRSICDLEPGLLIKHLNGDILFGMSWSEFRGLMSAGEWWMFSASALGVFINAAIAAMAVRQLRAARMAAEAAKDSAGAAKESLSATTVLAERGVRAWVRAEGATVKFRSPEGIPLKTQIILRNAGQTVARNVRIKNGWVAAPEIPDDLTFSAYEMPSRNIAPSDAAYILIELGFKEIGNMLRMEISQGQKALFVFGTLVYDDVFGHEHHTEWCMGFHTHVSGGEFIFANKHNDSD